MNLFRMMAEGEPAAWVLFGYASLAPIGVGLGIYLVRKTIKEEKNQ